MPFIPLSTNRRPDDFPRVSAAEQAARDAEAEQIVAAEFSQDMPDENRAALESEYRHRFSKPEPSARGFIPLVNAEGAKVQRGFVPLQPAEPETPSVLKTVLLENPGTAAIETGANLLSQGVALPVAGLAGIGTAAAKALGLTDRDPADVVHAVGGALTYQPRGEFGKAATAAVMTPFEKLAEVGQGAGDMVLDATGSPVLATAVDTSINALPMAIAPAAKGAKAVKDRFSTTRSNANEQAKQATSEAPTAAEAGQQSEAARGGQAVHQNARGAGTEEVATPRGFIPLESIDAETTATTQTRAGRLAGDDPAMHGADPLGLEALRGQGRDGMPALDGIRELPGGRGAGTDASALAGAVEGAGELRTRQRPMDDAAATGAAQDVLQASEYRRPGGDGGRGGARGGSESGYSAAAPGERPTLGEPTGREAVSGLEVADAQRRNPAAAAMGEADRPAVTGAMESDQTRLAGREGVDAQALQDPRTARYALIEAGDLKPSKDLRASPDWYEGEKKTQAIVSEFEPRRLMDALDDADGAPIVARDGAVQAGDKRAEAIKRIYQANGIKADGYRQHLRDNADALGLDPAAIDQMKKPVLVRVPDEAAPGLTRDMAGRVQNSWAPGANWAPMVDQMHAPTAKAKTVVDLPDPLRREQIVADLAKALDTTIYEGRVKGKNRLGFFRPSVSEVRIKNAADIEVAAHEIAHLIDHRVPEISNAWRSNKALRDELKSVSYDKKSVTEGFAEGVRLFLTQPETLEARAPRAYAWLESFAQDHKYGPALRKAQEQMTGWFGQDALNRARSKIGSEKPLAEYFDRFWDKFRQSTVDDLHGIMQMERSMTGKINPNGPYESARLSRASASIADGAIRFGYPEKARDGSFSWKGKGLEEILKPVAESLDDALLYFVGRSAAELMAQKREHLFTKGEIDGMLNLRTPEREKAFQDYQAWNRGILDFAEAQNIINPESRRLWQRTQYLPFHRVEQPGGIKGKPGDWSGIQALTGGTTNIKDVLGNMIGNAAMLLDKAVKNEARLKVARLSQMEGGGKFMVKIEPGERMVKIGGDQVLTEMFKKYGIAIDGDVPAFFEFLIKGQPPAGSNVVAVLQKGKPVWFEVGDPVLYRSLTAIDRPVQSEVVRWLGLPKRIGQASITTVPEFWLANMARDTIMGSVMSRAGFRPILDSLDGMRMRIAKDPLYKEWIANGGGLSSIFLDEGHFRTKLEKFYGRQGIDYRTVLDTPGKILNMVETLGDAFESSTRLGEYKRARARGDNPRHAAYLARDVSTDFAMKGDSKALGFMYDTVMFLRPALVSWDRLYRGVAHDPHKGAIAAKAGTIAMLSAGLYLLNKDDPRYADLPDWDRDANWHFFVGEHHFRYPKIWEIGAMASAAERSVEKIIEADPQGLGKDFARILGATFNLNYMPQILAPLADQATNRNSFTKAPIETPGMENVQPFLRSKPGTSETMKAAGMATRDLPEALQVNPVRAEALLRGYFNTWALYGLMLSDQAMFRDQVPERRADELPVVRRFYANEPAKHTKYETAFYDLLQESKRLRGTMKELDDLGLRTFADDKEASPLAGEAKPLERAAKNLGVINKDAEQVRRSDATPAEKRQKLDALTIERNALLKAAVTESKAAQKAKEVTPADIARKGLSGAMQ